MHPTDKKNAIYIGLLLLGLLPVLLFFWIKSFIFILATIVVLFIIDKYTEKLIHALILAWVLSAIGFITFFVAEQILLLMSQWNSYLLAFCVIFSVVVPALLYLKIYEVFANILEASANEKSNYFAIKRFPHLVCNEHHARTIFKKEFGYKNVSCRVKENCFAKKRLQYAHNIVGILGKSISGNSGGNYYVPILDEEEQRINNADYDILEIHESPEINDYNGIINKIIDFLYNEINRYKPVNKIIIRLVGAPDISESSKRLLKERFMKVEYVTK
jgi:hypothetical protein